MCQHCSYWLALLLREKKTHEGQTKTAWDVDNTGESMKYFWKSCSTASQIVIICLLLGLLRCHVQLIHFNKKNSTMSTPWAHEKIWCISGWRWRTSSKLAIVELPLEHDIKCGSTLPSCNRSFPQWSWHAPSSRDLGQIQQESTESKHHWSWRKWWYFHRIMKRNEIILPDFASEVFTIVH